MTSCISTPLAAKLRSLMTERGESSRALAVALGLSNSTVSAWLRGSQPHPAQLRQIAAHYSLPADVLVDNTKPLPSSAASASSLGAVLNEKKNDSPVHSMRADILHGGRVVKTIDLGKCSVRLLSDGPATNHTGLFRTSALCLNVELDSSTTAVLTREFSYSAQLEALRELGANTPKEMPATRSAIADGIRRIRAARREWRGLGCPV